MKRYGKGECPGCGGVTVVDRSPVYGLKWLYCTACGVRGDESGDYVGMVFSFVSSVLLENGGSTETEALQAVADFFGIEIEVKP